LNQTCSLGGGTSVIRCATCPIAGPGWGSTAISERKGAPAKSSLDALLFDLLVSQRAGLLFKSSVIEITGNRKQVTQISAMAAAKLLYLRGKEGA